MIHLDSGGAVRILLLYDQFGYSLPKPDMHLYCYTCPEKFRTIRQAHDNATSQKVEMVKRPLREGTELFWRTIHSRPKNVEQALSSAQRSALENAFSALRSTDTSSLYF